MFVVFSLIDYRKSAILVRDEPTDPHNFFRAIHPEGEIFFSSGNSAEQVRPDPPENVLMASGSISHGIHISKWRFCTIEN
jgi:hypothetical protein